MDVSIAKPVTLLLISSIQPSFNNALFNLRGAETRRDSVEQYTVLQDHGPIVQELGSLA